MRFQFPCRLSFEEIEQSEPCVCKSCRDHELCLNYFATFCDNQSEAQWDKFKKSYNSNIGRARSIQLRWAKQLELGLGEK